MIIYLFFLSFFFIASFAHQFNFTGQDYSLSSFLARILFFDRFIAEYVFTTTVILLLINGKFFLRLIAYLLLTFFLFINCIQLISITQGGEFLSRLAIDNVNHINILLNAQSLTIPFLAIILILVPEAVIQFAKLQPASGKTLFLKLPR